MAVPKRKTSKARRDQRRAHWKLTVPGIVECPQCHEPKLAHRVCKKCGYYDGKQAVAGETLPFKVIELRRSTRRILVSHTRTYAEAKEAKAAAEIDTTKKAVKKINSTIEKTTLGDISELAALKNKLEKGE